MDPTTPVPGKLRAAPPTVAVLRRALAVRGRTTAPSPTPIARPGPVPVGRRTTMVAAAEAFTTIPAIRVTAPISPLREAATQATLNRTALTPHRPRVPTRRLHARTLRQAAVTVEAGVIVEGVAPLTPAPLTAAVEARMVVAALTATANLTHDGIWRYGCPVRATFRGFPLAKIQGAL